MIMRRLAETGVLLVVLAITQTEIRRPSAFFVPGKNADNPQDMQVGCSTVALRPHCIFTATGYLKVVRIKDEYPGQAVDYAFFVITDCRPSIKEFLLRMEGNSFVEDNAVGLGCYHQVQYGHDVDRFITFMNADGKFEMNCPALFSSSRRSPVSLSFVLQEPERGSGAPCCFSFVRIRKVFGRDNH